MCAQAWLFGKTNQSSHKIKATGVCKKQILICGLGRCVSYHMWLIRLYEVLNGDFKNEIYNLF